MWNRLRYTVWAPAYDAIVRAAGFDTARRLSIDRLRLASGDRVLIVGAGTGLDLDFLPSNVHVTTVDVTPAMLKHLELRAAGMGPVCDCAHHGCQTVGISLIRRSMQS